MYVDLVLVRYILYSSTDCKLRIIHTSPFVFEYAWDIYPHLCRNPPRYKDVPIHINRRSR